VAELPDRIADGYITPSPAKELIDTFRSAGGQSKPIQAGYKVAWGTDDDAAVRTAHRLWANSGLPGELSQILPSPKHFEQASELVDESATRKAIAFGSDAQRHLDAFQP